MGTAINTKELRDKVSLLELQVKHLKNDLRLTREENETAITNYFEIYSDVETKVAERTKDNKGLKKKLEQKAIELELMLNSLPGIIFYKDREQRILRVNKNFTKMVGLSVNEIIGRKYTDLFPDDKVSHLKADLEVVQNGKPLLNRKESIQTSEGIKKILIDRRPYKDIDNHVIGLIGFALDITNLEKAGEEKRKLEGQLQYVQRMKSIGTLAGGIAHNFNNLLMGILGNASLMLLKTDSNDENYQNLKIIEKLVKSGSKLTKQLLGYAREGNYEVKVWNLNHLIRDTSHTFSVTRKEISINYDLADGLPGIKVDREQIGQALLNLYINAADAIQECGDLFLKTMCITHEDIRDKPYKPKPGHYVLLTVRDTGVGMDKKTMERIFEPFFTTKGLAKGTGLGLASVYGIIKAHAGYIDVSSEKGKGTTFSIYLPVTEERVENQKEQEPEPKLLKGNGNILLVDDDEMIIGMGEKILEKLGYGVITAESGKKALELYKYDSDKIDIVLLDMIMPDMSGGQTFDRLKEINPDIKIILSSGYSIDGQAQGIMDRGCDGFIQKPFSIEELSQKIMNIL